LLNLELGYGDDEDETSLQTNSDGSSWFPYPSKLSFLLDTVDNLPRLRISSSQMKVILWLLHEVGVKGVPSFINLRKIQKKLKDNPIVPTIHLKSPKGNTFSFNDPRALIANVSSLLNTGNYEMCGLTSVRTGQIHFMRITSDDILFFQRMVLFLKCGMPASGVMTLIDIASAQCMMLEMGGTTSLTNLQR